MVCCVSQPCDRGVWSSSKKSDAMISYSSEFLRSLRFRDCTISEILKSVPDFLVRESDKSSVVLSRARGSRVQEHRAPSRTASKVEQRRNVTISISLEKDVVLKKADNAWKPKLLTSAVEDANQVIYKKFRSVLNKLTPEKFDKLSNQLLELDIDSDERRTEAVRILYDKAVTEHSFAKIYARLCVALTKRHPSFKKVLVTKCRTEFKKIYGKKEPLPAAQDAEAEKKIRDKYVGCVKFIGELYNMDMLESKVMTTCFDRLLSSGDETCVECCCKLLRIIDSTLELKQVTHLLACYNGLKLIVRRESQSTRIRFMIEDVLNPETNRWLSRV